MTNWKNRLSPTVQSLPPSGLKKFFDICQVMEDVTTLGVGEPDFVTPEVILNGCISALRRGDTGYTSSYGLPQLRRAITRDIEKHYGVTYSPDSEVLVTIGVSEALDMALRAILAPGDEVLLPEPCYVANKACVLLAGGVPVPVITYAEEGFVVNEERLAKAVTPRTKAIVIGYPNNPTGATMSGEELAAVARVAAQHDLLVISDELYAHLTFEGTHTCFSALPGMKDRTLLLNGFSKSYAMTGQRIGYALGPAELIEAMVSIHQYGIICAPVASQWAAVAALEQADEDRDRMMQAYQQRRLIMIEGLRRLGLPTFAPKGAFYIFPSIKETGLSSAAFAEELLVNNRVAVIPGSAFGDSGEGYIRCAYASSEENLRKALGRMDQFLHTLRQQ